MAASIAPQLSSLPRKNPAKASLRGETSGHFLSSLDLGAVIERAIALSGLTKDQASQLMGYANASHLSQWVRNQEPPNFARLWAVEGLRAGIVAALAERAGNVVEVETNIRIRRTA